MSHSKVTASPWSLTPLHQCPARLADHAGTTLGKSFLLRCAEMDGFSPEGIAVFTTRDNIASGASAGRRWRVVAAALPQRPAGHCHSMAPCGRPLRPCLYETGDREKGHATTRRHPSVGPLPTLANGIVPVNATASWAPRSSRCCSASPDQRYRSCACSSDPEEATAIALLGSRESPPRRMPLFSPPPRAGMPRLLMQPLS